MNNNKDCKSLGRRAFLHQGTLLLTGTLTVAPFDIRNAFAETETSILRIGLLTDIHYADKEMKINRYYRESPAKLAVAADEFAKQRLDFVVELGDLIDSVRSVESDQKNLRLIDTELRKISDKRHYVLGNHCVETLTKKEFLSEIGQEKSYYSFDSNNYHFVVLDACFRQDGVAYGRNNSDWKDTIIPDTEIEWLKADLAATKLPSICFLHQRLDLENKQPCAVKNSDHVRAVLEKSGKIRLVLQGHEHRGDYKEIAEIHYCTISAMIEGSGLKNNSFSLLEITENGNLRLHGFFKQKSREL
ncbi:MAG: metallophosphoesterase, partial [Planctomycetaceae bacterium]|nr:metallophosphoesterase [Planctomycetaceae bacterium]